MSLPRFYQVELRDMGGLQRWLAVDLVDTRAVGDAAILVRSLAATVATRDASRRARTSYVEAPARGAVLRPLWSYAWGDGAPNSERLRRHLDMLGDGREVHRFALRPGAWAEGADLVGREELLVTLAGQLGAGAHLHLMAPRRYGKTSIVRAVESRLLAEGRTVVQVDVESDDTLARLAVRLVDETFRVTEVLRALDELRSWPPREASLRARDAACQSLHDTIGSSPVGFLERVCRELARADAILLADEFTRFVLETMPREQRGAFIRALEALACTPGLAVMVCGSQGLRGFVDWHDLGPLRDLESVALGPLDAGAAAILVEELFYGDGYPPLPEAVDAALEAVGAPIPYFLHGLVHHTTQEQRSGRAVSSSPIDRATVERAYERRLLDQEGNEFFRNFRLKERGYPDVLRRPAATLLRVLALSPEPVPMSALRASCKVEDESFELLLAALVEDYDVVLDDAGARFRSKVMRERWARREAWARGGDE